MKQNRSHRTLVRRLKIPLDLGLLCAITTSTNATELSMRERYLSARARTPRKRVRARVAAGFVHACGQGREI